MLFPSHLSRVLINDLLVPGFQSWCFMFLFFYFMLHCFGSSLSWFVFRIQDSVVIFFGFSFLMLEASWFRAEA